MKLCSALISTLCLLVALSSCSSAAEKPEDISTPTSSVINNENSAQFANAIEQTEAFYSIEEGLFKVKYGLVDFNISFPQVLNHANQKTGDKVNGILYDSVIRHEYFMRFNTRFEVSIDYKITLASEKYLSVLYYGMINYEGGYVDFAEAVTVDMTTATIVMLSDFYSTDEIIKLIEDNMSSEDVTIFTAHMSPFEGISLNDLQPVFIEQFKQGNLSFYIESDSITLFCDISPILRENVYVKFHRSNPKW